MGKIISRRGQKAQPEKIQKEIPEDLETFLYGTGVHGQDLTDEELDNIHRVFENIRKHLDSMDE
jgi:hypothetical protein